MEASILNFAGSDEVDQFTRADRWRRLAVQTLADIFEVNRETVRLRLAALQGRGQIDRQAPSGMHDGKWRRDSLVRLVIGREE
jgi:predicted transcriptional regulator of viral defense system